MKKVSFRFKNVHFFLLKFKLFAVGLWNIFLSWLEGPNFGAIFEFLNMY